MGAGHPQARWACAVSPSQRGDSHACEPPPPAAPGAPRADERGLAQTVGRGAGGREGERALGPCLSEAPHGPPVSASLSCAAQRAVRVAGAARAWRGRSPPVPGGGGVPRLFCLEAWRPSRVRSAPPVSRGPRLPRAGPGASPASEGRPWALVRPAPAPAPDAPPWPRTGTRGRGQAGQEGVLPPGGASHHTSPCVREGAQPRWLRSGSAAATHRRRLSLRGVLQ